MRTPIDIKKMTKENNSFRRVVDTGKFGQLVLISLRKDENLGDEMHPKVDELYYLVDGVGEIKIDGKSYPFEEDAVMLVPAGAKHDILNTGKDGLKLFAMFTSPVHPENEMVPTREKAFATSKR